MAGVVALTVIIMVAFTIGKTVGDFWRNVGYAKRSGLPYIVGPFYIIGYQWVFLAAILRPVLHRIPPVRSSGWFSLLDRNVSWTSPRVAEHRYGDTYLVVTPFIIYLRTSNAELVSQITTRKTDFLKPVRSYKIVDLFGKSILTQEGAEWKRHRKIVGPSFSERSNRLVFEESVRQAEGMMELWAGKGGNTGAVMKLSDTAEDAATLSLHVISAAGFGVPQFWENQRPKDGEGLPGFSTEELTNGHQLSFKVGLTELLNNLVWFVLVPPWMLKVSPFKFHRRAYQAFLECSTYFRELLEIKKKQICLGEIDKGAMDLLGPMIKANYEENQTDLFVGATLTREEILGNSFIFLFAGHETTANNIHFSILLLAMHLPTQRRMQVDIDSILGSKSSSAFSYQHDMPRLYNSMVGAVLTEELRLIPAILNIPKVISGEQNVSVDGKQVWLPDQVFMHINVVGTNRNPRYWPEDPDAFKPERWLPHGQRAAAEVCTTASPENEADGLESTTFITSTATSLLKPPKGAFMTFSDGGRACPGRRFAQVESTAVVSTIFRKYSVELDVSEWASDEQVAEMGREARKAVYRLAVRRAEGILRRCEQVLTLRMARGDEVPVRFVERGRERFGECF
ncbi:putative cytochrome P450 monooxygenase [Drepanopeziza brunnea f. sp. 'multigermtubi' MB_m1]|uniref:Putative cytochrome P450 monooxygenase n=1 Tax=Marssonina brunnea f. sp. multigermtubi (strain MB_m1) TaxID=1072389 RepID=K1X2C1_MARBU|nr:putative cytochrome P450 monooxygenase [Drepanopeziza brunnea f. sp. 'multigermtubi' MB_m1]EKD19127.1 putative cytochrome P450 monooxygenase [Drepanopeziza brunnea f. sp. 'multigermtubi' MB_m1]